MQIVTDVENGIFSVILNMIQHYFEMSHETYLTHGGRCQLIYLWGLWCVLSLHTLNVLCVWNSFKQAPMQNWLFSL